MTIKIAETKKMLVSQLQKISAKIESKSNEKKEIIADLLRLENKQKNIKEKIKILAKKQNFTISEHAMLRYVQRVLDVNTDLVEENILKKIELASKKLGETFELSFDGFTVVVKNKTVVTIK